MSNHFSCCSDAPPAALQISVVYRHASRGQLACISTKQHSMWLAGTAELVSACPTATCRGMGRDSGGHALQNIPGGRARMAVTSEKVGWAAWPATEPETFCLPAAPLSPPFSQVLTLPIDHQCGPSCARLAAIKGWGWRWWSAKKAVPASLPNLMADTRDVRQFFGC